MPGGVAVKAQAATPDNGDSDDEEWFRELISARGIAFDAAVAMSLTVCAVARASRSDSEVAARLAEPSSATGSSSSRRPLRPRHEPEVDAAAIRAAAPASAPEEPESWRGRSRPPPAVAAVSPKGMLPLTQRTRPGRATHVYQMSLALAVASILGML